ncbi:hypothetical protein TcWFU_005778 [Taenia crassiceps]|uniref:Uncharacterized protein n=1 Tax=Taenia crassiceps TaxID=6207 RepID=A0ABR4QE28_9CEST
MQNRLDFPLAFEARSHTCVISVTLFAEMTFYLSISKPLFIHVFINLLSCPSIHVRDNLEKLRELSTWNLGSPLLSMPSMSTLWLPEGLDTRGGEAQKLMKTRHVASLIQLDW